MSKLRSIEFIYSVSHASLSLIKSKLFYERFILLALIKFNEFRKMRSTNPHKDVEYTFIEPSSNSPIKYVTSTQKVFIKLKLYCCPIYCN